MQQKLRKVIKGHKKSQKNTQEARERQKDSLLTFIDVFLINYSLDLSKQWRGDQNVMKFGVDAKWGTHNSWKVMSKSIDKN